MATSYQWIELGVHTALNTLSGNGSAAAVEAILTSSAALAANAVYDQAFAPADVRKAILDQEYALIAMLCRTPGHPERGRFERREEVAHGANLPESLSTFDTFLFEDRPVRKRTAPSEIDAIRQDPTMKPETPYYAIHGNVFYCTEDDATAVFYGTDNDGRSVSSASALAAKFSSPNIFMLLPDEFALPLIFLTTAQLALYGDSEEAQSGALVVAAEKLLSAAGIRPV